MLIAIALLGCSPDSTSFAPTQAGLVGDASEDGPRTGVDLRDGQVYKGLWAPALTIEGAQSMDDPERLLEDGFDTVAVPRLLVVRDGKVLRRTSDKDMQATMLRYEGFRVLVTLDIITERADGEIVPTDTLPGDEEFLARVDEEVASLARLAETEGADLFAPVNEADLRFGERAHEMPARLLRVSRDNWSGPVMWKGGGDTSLDVRGYDIVGNSINVPDHANLEMVQADVRFKLEGLEDQAADCDVDALMVTEFGLWGGDFSHWDADLQEAFYEEVFETAPDYDGYFAFDGPFGHDMSLAGSVGEEVVSDWYLNRL